MIDVKDEATESEKQEKAVVRKVEKKHIRLLSQIDKCMMNMKVNKDQKDEIMKLAKSDMDADLRSKLKKSKKSPKVRY